MKKLLLLFILLFFYTTNSQAGLISRHTDYAIGSEVTADNLNGNFNNVYNVVNGGLDNDNINISSVRLLEILGALPVNGTQGRVVFLTTDNTLNFDTGSAWVKPVITSDTPAQGDLLYYNGTAWKTLVAGTSGYILKTQGAGANPTWLNTLPTANGGTGATANSNAANGVCILDANARVATGNLGSGSATSSTYLRGDQSWQTLAITSNVLFTWNGVDVVDSDKGFLSATSLTDAVTAPKMGYIVGSTTSYVTVLTGKFTKISGISTITVFARLWSQNVASDQEALCNINVGGQTLVLQTTESITPTWLSGTIDVSSLTNTTTYDITIQLKNETNPTRSCLSAITLIGS
ncbi:hypothetical protein M0R04_11895 [Candidatus Dojkabacteria bacterium]|jgi:hypothetical protein|nr:hypothetical protein [Candidatus Dojkabacteria bacterium]